MARVIVEIRTGRDVLRFEKNAEVRHYSDRGERLLELKEAIGALESLTADVRAIMRASEPTTIGGAV